MFDIKLRDISIDAYEDSTEITLTLRLHGERKRLERIIEWIKEFCDEDDDESTCDS